MIEGDESYMLRKEDIELNKYIYWTCSSHDAVKIAVTEINDKTGRCVVETKEGKPFTRSLYFLFKGSTAARHSIREYNHARRKYKRSKKKNAK